VLPVPPVSAQCRHCLILSSPFLTSPLATGSDIAQPHMSAAAPMSLAPRCLPYSQRARRVRVACSARRCPSDPEPPRSCRAGPCCAAPHPSSPLLLLPPRGTEPDPPLALFLPARAAEPPQKGIARRRPSFHLFSSHLHQCTMPPPPLPSPRHPCPPTVTERRRNALDSARTTPPPAFIGERRSELRSFTTNRP
jgi:hypothetical protein